jgi:succinoglycan biosynthesis transport protein ExoP
MEHAHSYSAQDTVSLRDIEALLWRRKWIMLLVMAVALGATYWITARMPRKWQATSLLIVNPGAPSMSTSSDSVNITPLTETPETQLTLLKAYGMRDRTVNWMKNDAFAKGEASDKLGMINDSSIWEHFNELVKFSNPENTSVLEITATMTDPNRAAALANATAQAFVEWKKEIAQKAVDDRTTSLEIRAQKAREQMLLAEQRETEFKKGHKVVDVSTEEKAALESFLQREKEVDNLQQDVSSQVARLSEIESRIHTTSRAVNSGVQVRDVGVVAALQQQLNTLETNRAGLALRFGPEYPDMKVLDAQIQDVKARLASAIKTSVDASSPSLQTSGNLMGEYQQSQIELRFARAKLVAAISLRDQAKARTAGLPVTSMEYARRSRDAELARNTYTELQSALNKVRLNKDITLGNVQQSAQALPPDEPFSPNELKNMLQGGVIGLALAVLSALLADRADRRIRTIRDFDRLALGPVIGSLPHLPRAQVHQLIEGSIFPQAVEAFGMARANFAMTVRRSGHREPWNHHVILITSSVPGEGKSVTAAHLARSIARAGRSVILMDADMRRPMQCRLFNTEEPIGLADVLAGDVSLDEALVTSDTENLFILHSGSPSRNPTELIALPKMAEIVAALRQEADVLLIDTPACSVVADAFLLTPYADSIIHVVGAGIVDEEITSHTLAALRTAIPETIAIFINHARRERRGPYSTYASYHYYSARADRPPSVPLLPGRDADDTALNRLQKEGQYPDGDG